MSDVDGNSNDETNFPRKLFLTNTQVSRLRIAFANNCSANIILLKTQLLQIGQSRGFLGRLLGPLLQTEKKRKKTKKWNRIICNLLD